MHLTCRFSPVFNGLKSGRDRPDQHRILLKDAVGKVAGGCGAAAEPKDIKLQTRDHNIFALKSANHFRQYPAQLDHRAIGFGDNPGIVISQPHPPQRIGFVILGANTFDIDFF